MAEFYTYTLPNGIRGIHRQVKGGVTRCALCINAGSRDELPKEFGLAHFCEHGLFKGTLKRKAYQVNCRLENLGGELNAFTTKEDTTIHATTLKGEFSKALELVADVAFHSTFPEHELRKEREVIFDEINTYKDSPAEMIYDEFEDLLFAGSELGHNILGRKATLKGFDQHSCLSFIQRCHTTDQMVLSTIGNLSSKRIEALALRHFGEVASTQRSFSRQAPNAVAPFDLIRHKHTHQTHCIIGTRAYSIDEKQRLPLGLAINILGGPSANSRLNLSVRERHGLSYSVEAAYTPYGDTGLVMIYFSSDHEHGERCCELILQEIDRLKREPLTERRLAMAKRQFIAQLAISMESNEGYMLGVGKSLLCHREIDTMEEVYRKVEALKSTDLCAAMEECFTSTSRLIYR